ncbi:SGNH/GDSL hydrolase family protein [Humitalea sp. 24SJ18S-53]|uniref:SGNH/GDSL hydrolase family protein n=1 Tax=Humitalea sp. 24SJ18S-53 TaxID=3422307 RepID=UPI003D664FFA
MTQTAPASRRRRLGLALALALALIAGLAGPTMAHDCPATAPEPVRLPELAADLAARRPITIVALGSSSTEGSGASGPDATYPARLQAGLRAALPGREITVLNKGIGGQDAAEMLLRLEPDALAHDPALIIWQVGTNGALRRHSPDRFREMMTVGVERAVAAGANVLLVDSQRGAWSHAAPERAAFDQVLADLANRPGVALFRRGALMDAWAARGTPPEAMLTADALHHNDRGYACLAAAITVAIVQGLPPQPAALTPMASRMP